MDFARDPVELSTWQDGFPDEDELAGLQNACLGRLRRLLRLRSDHHEDLNDQGLWLLDRSIFTTYCDCVELGAGFVAQGMVRRLSEERQGHTHRSLGDVSDTARRSQR
jgi:hypothetical protein